MNAAVLAIQEYIDEYLFEPSSTWPKYEFDMRCYSRWAANEILVRVAEESMVPEHITGKKAKAPLTIISEFISELDNHSEDCEDKQFIFSIAREVAVDIAHLFL